MTNVFNEGNTNNEYNRVNLESGSFKGLQSQSTQKDSTADKYNDSESQLNKPMTNASKEVSIDYKEQSNQKQYSFVSFVMEPSKKNKKSMKLRDKTKPLID